MITGILYAMAISLCSAAVFCATYTWISGGSLLACIVGALCCVAVAIIAALLLVASFMDGDDGSEDQCAPVE